VLGGGIKLGFKNGDFEVGVKVFAFF